MTTLAALLALLALIAYLPQFRLRDVAIYGRTSLLASDVREVVDPLPDQFFLQGMGDSPLQWLELRYGVWETGLMQRFPILQSARVRFRFPSTLRVEIVDKAEVVSARVPQGFALLDSLGQVISLRSEPSALLPITEGLTLTGAPVVGQLLPVDPAEFDLAVRLTAALIGADEAVPYETKLMTATRLMTIGGGEVRLDLTLDGGQRWRVLLEDNSQLQDNLITLATLIEAGSLADKGDGELQMGLGEVVFRPLSSDGSVP